MRLDVHDFKLMNDAHAKVTRFIAQQLNEVFADVAVGGQTVQ